MGLPPPMAMIQSGWKSSMAFCALPATVSTDGSGLDALEDLNLEAGLLRSASTSCRSAPRHGAATGDDHGAGTLEVLHLMTGALTKVQVARVGKTSHMCLKHKPLSA